MKMDAVAVHKGGEIHGSMSKLVTLAKRVDMDHWYKKWEENKVKRWL